MRALSIAAVTAAAALSATAVAGADVTPAACAKEAGGGIWESEPAGTGQFMVMVFPDAAGRGHLYTVTWESPGLVRTDNPERYSNLNLGFHGIFLSADRPPDRPLSFSVDYRDPKSSTTPRWPSASIRSDLLPNGQAGRLVLALDGGREWGWDYKPDRPPGTDGAVGYEPFQLRLEDPAAADELNRAIGKARRARLTLRNAAGAELAALDMTLPTEAEWANLRSGDMPRLVGISNHPFPQCLSRLPFWFRWDDLKAGKVPLLQREPPRRLDPATGKPMADRPAGFQ